GREEAPRQQAPAWSFERPRVTADAAETSVMPVVRDEPAPPPARRSGTRSEPVVVARRPEPSPARPEPVEVRSSRGTAPEPAEVRPERFAGSAEARSGSPGSVERFVGSAEGRSGRGAEPGS